MGKMKNPMGGNLSNPLNNGQKSKKLSEHRKSNMKRFGIKPSGNPLGR